ncbi:thioredoxin-disulfide reductase [Patescibacteria group bacterium]|nr:thioredoxin-disulfide reductase [Patescibacteria group bacterium]
MAEKIYDTVIIGSGPAGLTAAIYASRGKLSTLVIAGVEAGGQLMLTTDVEDYPGFPEVIQGPELMSLMRKQAERLGAEIINDDITKTDLSKRPFKVSTNSQNYLANTLIIAAGASAKWLGLPSEKKLIGKGISSCAVCDAAFFKEKKVAVVGGGDSAMREALFLTKFASEVTIIHRRSELRAFPVLQDRAFANKKIKFIWNSEVKEVLGEVKVEGLILNNIKTKKTSEMKLDGLFIAIGHKPNTGFLKGQIEMDNKGYVVLKNHSKTSVSGVFAAGDVHDWHYQQAVTAAGAGCMAAMDAEELLEEEKAKVKAPKALATS